MNPVKFDRSSVYAGLNTLGLAISKEQSKWICQFAAHIFSEVETDKFISLPKTESLKTPLSNLFKLHLFFNESTSTLDIYIVKKPSLDQITENCKTFTRAFCISFSARQKNPTISKAARLQGKLYDSQGIFSERLLNNLSQEVATLQEFKGKPFICQILNHAYYWGRKNGQEKAKFVFYTDLCDCDLEQFMKEHINSSFDQRLRFILPIYESLLKAFVEIHKKYTHHDIKLENIFINKSDFKTEVGDFGYAQKPGLKLSSTICGTLGSFSPEYFSALHDPSWTGTAMNPSHDMWALGIVLYFLINHAFPNFSYLVESCFKLEILNKDLKNLINTIDDQWRMKNKDNSLLHSMPQCELMDQFKQLKMNNEVYRRELRTLRKILSDFPMQTLASISLRNENKSELKNWNYKMKDIITPICIDEALVVNLAKHPIVHGCPFLNAEFLGLMDIQKELESELTEFKDHLNDLLAKIWNILEKNNNPNFTSVFDLLIWKMFRPNPQERITASESLDIFNLIIRPLLQETPSKSIEYTNCPPPLPAYQLPLLCSIK